jgi:UDP-N-acetylmuramoyl-tripeptide--D-alanyl-D-alanine ligase
MTPLKPREVLWTAADAAAATAGRSQGDWAVTGISIDSRYLQPGDLFVALTAVRDGHDFVAHALQNGAVAALVSRIPDGVPKDAPLLLVADVLDGLTALGAAGRARSNAQVIAVTGSVGKTSTKEMLRDMLSGQGRVHAAEASFNNHWGVPITLARLPVSADFAIIEIGMNHPGEIAPLAALARPHLAMITTIAAAHLEAFADLDAIAVEKASVFTGLEGTKLAVFPSDSAQTPILAAAATAVGATQWTFGENAPNVQTKALRHTADCLVLEVCVSGVDVIVRLQGAGAHFARNAVGCLAVAQALGLNIALSALGIGRWTPPAGRGRREQVLIDPAENESFTLIDDAFNANPESMAAALTMLADIPLERDASGRLGRRVAVLGDMLELGVQELALHEAVAQHPSMASIDKVHCAGPRMAALYALLPDHQRGLHVERAEALGASAHHMVRPGDIVLVKGSKGSKVSRVVDVLRNLGQAEPTE